MMKTGICFYMCVLVFAWLTSAGLSGCGYNNLSVQILDGRRQEAIDAIQSGKTDVNKPFSFTKTTPLFSAARRNDIEIARMLVEKGADVNVRDDYGMTPLNISIVFHSDGPIVDLLLQNGADPNIPQSSSSLLFKRLHAQPNEPGSTPLMAAASRGNLDLARKLVEQGSNVNDINVSGFRAAHYAVLAGNADLAGYLLNKEATVNHLKDNAEGLYASAGLEFLRALQTYLKGNLVSAHELLLVSHDLARSAEAKIPGKRQIKLTEDNMKVLLATALAAVSANAQARTHARTTASAAALRGNTGKASGFGMAPIGYTGDSRAIDVKYATLMEASAGLRAAAKKVGLCLNAGDADNEECKGLTEMLASVGSTEGQADSQGKDKGEVEKKGPVVILHRVKLFVDGKEPYAGSVRDREVQAMFIALKNLLEEEQIVSIIPDETDTGEYDYPVNLLFEINESSDNHLSEDVGKGALVAGLTLGLVSLDSRYTYTSSIKLTTRRWDGIEQQYQVKHEVNSTYPGGGRSGADLLREVKENARLKALGNSMKQLLDHIRKDAGMLTERNHAN